MNCGKDVEVFITSKLATVKIFNIFIFNMIKLFFFRDKYSEFSMHICKTLHKKCSAIGVFLCSQTQCSSLALGYNCALHSASFRLKMLVHFAAIFLSQRLLCSPAVSFLNYRKIEEFLMWLVASPRAITSVKNRYGNKMKDYVTNSMCFCILVSAGNLTAAP